MEINLKDLKERPEGLLLLIDKYVKVKLIKDLLFEGYVQSIDPITLSIILLVPTNAVHQTVLFPGHSIISLTETILPNEPKPPSRKNTRFVVTDVLKFKIKVMEWLKKNLLPVSECDNKIILGNVSILPPYRTVDICTDNVVIALQIRRIMENMPDDFEPSINN